MDLNFIRKKMYIATILIIIMITTSCSNKEDMNVFIEITNGDQSYSITRDSLYNNVEAINFPATVRSSGNKPVETEYKGIELSKLFTSLDINTSNKQKITFNATDGYKIVLDIEEIYEPNNVYLTFERDGEYLKSKEQGGNGPFQLVIRHDPFSQRWCKHVNEIVVE